MKFMVKSYIKHVYFSSKKDEAKRNRYSKLDKFDTSPVDWLYNSCLAVTSNVRAKNTDLFLDPFTKGVVGAFNKKGHKSKGISLLSKICFCIKSRISKDPNKFLYSLIHNIGRTVEIRRVKKNKTVTQIPIVVTSFRQLQSTIRFWIKCSSSIDRFHSMGSWPRLVTQSLEAYLGHGLCVKKRNELYSLVNKSKVFLKFHRNKLKE